MILEMKNITKTYGRVVANNNVSIHLNEGEILSIVGENGAGKSTLMKILYGLEKPNSGSVFVGGKQVDFHNPSDAMALGIGMVQQHFMLFGPMTVAENIIYNNEHAKLGFLQKKKNIQLVKELSEKYMLYVDPYAKVQDCAVGTQQRIEILKTLYQNADIIIFDEPSAVLTPPEVTELLKTMRQLSKMGKSLILITHKLNEVMEVSDRVIVMRGGNKVEDINVKNTNAEDLSFKMIGRQVAHQELPERPLKETVLKVENLSMGSLSGKKVLDNINLNVNSGEIVGIAGVSGNGQTELIHCICGLQRQYEGHVEVCGKEVSHSTVHEVRAAGLTHIPEDRYLWGSVKEASLSENILMGDEDKMPFSRKGILNSKAIAKHVDGLIKQYQVKADSRNQKMRELSGGNAQKLITAREIERGTPFLIACEPTRGIDIGAMEFVHERLIKKRETGGILLVSSELSETLKLSDRIYVMYEGKIQYEFQRGTVDEKKLGILMMGGQVNEDE